MFPDYDDEETLTGRRRRSVREGGLSRHPLTDPLLVQDFLAQGEAWCTVGLEYVEVAAMEPAHALATANFILDRAKAIALSMLASGDDTVTEITVADDKAARLVLVDTPLVQALIDRGRQPVSPTVPWAGVGGVGPRSR